MGIGDAVQPVKSVTIDEMAQAFADQFGGVTWGSPGAEAADKIEVTLQLKNPLEQNLNVVERIRLTCTEGATMALKAAGNGTVLAGDGTEDMIIETDVATGTFDLEVTYALVGTVTVVGGGTQGSGFVGCKESVDLVFA
jgi:hypothetical protein